ncbi:unnamed protein product, partial [Staurois parvus]
MSVTPETTKQLIHSLIISRLDYCNSLLTGLPHHRLSPLQSVLNTAARLIHLSNCSISATPLCQSLHWLHPPLPIPPLAPPPSANPSTGSTPLCQSLH